MPMERFDDDLNIVAGLGDDPKRDDGLSTQGFKSIFDKAGLRIQDFINNKLIPYIEKQNVGLPLGGGTMEGPINMNGQSLSGLNAPTKDDEAATKGYADELKNDTETYVNNAVRTAAPRNLLDNSYFANPVNQRDVTDCTAQGYTIDRWIFRTGTADGEKVTVQDGGVRVTKTTTSDNYMAFKQSVNLSENKLAGKTVTFAAHVLEATTSFRLRITGGNSAASDTNVYAQTTFDSNGILFVTTTLPNPLPYDYFGVAISLESPGSVLIEWAALYEGEYTAETLPEYQPKGYGAELAECMRYYQKYQADQQVISFAVASINKRLNAFITLKVPLRAIPRVETINLCIADGVNTPESASFVEARFDEKIQVARISVLSSADTVTVYQTYLFRLGIDSNRAIGSIEFIADL